MRTAEGARRDILLTSRFIEESRRVVARELQDIDSPVDGFNDELAELLREEGRYPAPLFQ